MTPSQYVCHLEKYVQINFEYNQDAAAAFDCSPGFLSMVLRGSRDPSVNMMKATGHYLKQTIKQQYLKTI